MESNYTVKNLAKYFDCSSQTIRNYLKQIEEEKPKLVTRGKRNKYILTENGFQYLRQLLGNELTCSNNFLLKFIICDELKSLIDKDTSYTLQYTKRTRIKQKKDLTYFDQLPTLLQKRYEKFAKKFLYWLKRKFISSNITKIIVDRLPKWKQNDKEDVDIRITFYEGNHPQDLNLIIKEELTSLQEMKLEKFQQNLENNEQLRDEFSNLQFNTTNKRIFLSNLANLLNKIDDKRLIKKLFKLIVGANPHYQIIAEPEILIINFTKIKLPTKVSANYDQQENKLLINFNNNCNLTCSLEPEESEKLIINFQQVPPTLDLTLI
ncbi:HTH domain-containing protein [Natroniella acetigena]|uniref:HTH domain-containing protein n=1 Tax=Natroniella acetigena TaxID=52004 RepID=UPI00200A10E0|nr:HTH domain-containing protein [Natroniella acetigena]MCK8827457.1 HTH domain-containing protein [Natroniella acetigena]